MAKPTFSDIAAQARVGTATVERVLNGRGGVRPETAQKVILAARSLGYGTALPQAHRGLLRIEAIMVRPETTFYRRLNRAFERIAASLDPAVVLHRTFADETDPHDIATRIAAAARRRAGLILAVPDTPEIRHQVERAAAQGIHIVHVVTRASDRAGDFVGIDNRAAGRTAAMYIARMSRRSGPVVAMGHQIYQVHRDRLRGFSDYFLAHPGPLHLVWTGFSRDDDLRAAEVLRLALDRFPDLAALYNVGGANAALLDVLRRHPRGRDLFFVGHELTDYTAAALRDGTMDVVLDQAPEAQARRALDTMLWRIGLSDVEPDQAPIRFITVNKENI